MSNTQPAPRSTAARRLAAVVSVAFLVVLAGCGSDNVVADGALAKDKNIPTLTAPTTLPSVAGDTCKPATDIPKAQGKPDAVLMPTGKPPTVLETADLVVGNGPAVKKGDTINVNYIGIACSTGKQFDSSWDTPAQAKTGVQVALQSASATTQGVIEGWVRGIPGMRVGGRRQLVIPPGLAYGAVGQSGIAPGETLVFIVEVESIAPPATTTTTATGAGSSVPVSPEPSSTVAGGSEATTTTGQQTTTTTGG